MKLLFICNTFVAPSEVWMFRQAQGLRGFDVTVLAREFNFVDDSSQEFKTQFIPFPDFKSLKRWQRGYHLFRNAQYGMYRGTVGERKWLLDYLRTLNPDLIFCHYCTNAIKVAPFAQKLEIPLVAHGNGFDLSCALKSRWYRTRISHYGPKLAGFVVVAEYQRQVLNSLGVPDKNIACIPYGVPLSEFMPSDNTTNDDKCVFLAVGRMTEKKRPDLTLRAFAKCLQSKPDCRLRMIGDGPMMKSVHSLAKELGVEERVEFLGVQSTRVVRQEMHNADVFVQHSVTAENGDKEGWPVAIAEACASALPVVATRHAGIIDQIQNGDSGFLVDEHDYSTMGQRMIQLASDGPLRRSMGVRAREHIKKTDVQNQIRLLGDYLKEIADQQMST